MTTRLRSILIALTVLAAFTVGVAPAANAGVRPSGYHPNSYGTG